MTKLPTYQFRDTPMSRHRAQLKTKALKRYEQVPEYIRHDLVEAAIWARDTLTKLEGAGHDIQLSEDPNKGMCCSFAKPEWAGDHAGSHMDTASEAIVMAVCEYLEGM